jgi:protein-S-isoprenylcysteine O-methyltransferase Ste14
MWTIRFILLGALAALEGIGCYLNRRRSRYERLLENRIYNITGVIVWNCLCYLIVGLPPAGGWNLRPDWLGYQSVRIGFPVIGLLLICAFALVGFGTLKQRKVVGSQTVREGLLTSGFYRYFRHPIYTAIMWACLGLALAMRNPDGLLMFPAIFVIHFAAAIMEERYDMGVRFREQYQAYRQTTRMFGPIWLWGIIVMCLFVLIAAGSAKEAASLI